MSILSYTISEPSAAVQFIGSALAFALVALLALAAKLGAVVNERDDAQRAALEIQKDRDRYRERLAKERTVNNKIEAERERLAGEVADLNGMIGDLTADLNTAQAQLRHTAVTRDPKTGRMVSGKK